MTRARDVNPTDRIKNRRSCWIYVRDKDRWSEYPSAGLFLSLCCLFLSFTSQTINIRILVGSSASLS
ncbi:hypothetical protein Hanom_Chr17g01588171 [Helianthus anomalus]